jgi:hypothetical protein
MESSGNASVTQIGYNGIDTGWWPDDRWQFPGSMTAKEPLIPSTDWSEAYYKAPRAWFYSFENSDKIVARTLGLRDQIQVRILTSITAFITNTIISVVELFSRVYPN